MTIDIDLHDATLLAVHISWENGTCTVELRHGTLGHCVLTFSAVSYLALPRKQACGPSVSINSFSRVGSGRYEIWMQSGDLIEIEAANVVLTQSNHG
ncbi:hypothetical protein [Pseudoduganella lutea]|uniref:Uncharacterized protein n=1 Tax=Pseudoduganella lutea TaxID=321985 RepID=A0A4P6KZ90_9BURK|nr:hypothetical protein [Pseudoduganella lutea]QBE63922.1 hypothetical protein EWM63_13760 [Pseudoduganella lutea]